MTENDPQLEIFLEKKKPTTRKRISSYFKHYTECHNSTMTDLLTEAWQEQRGDTPPWTHKLPQRIVDYKEYLEGKGHSETTVKMAVSTIKSFYNVHRITPPMERLKYEKTDTIDRVVQTVDDLPGRDEIQKAVRHANLKFSAMIKVMATSGMDTSTTLTINQPLVIEGLGDMAETTMNDMLDIGETRAKVEGHRDGVIEWRVTRPKLARDHKNPEYYHTYSTPEAVIAILDYIEADPLKNWDDYIFRSRRTGTAITARSVFKYFNKLNGECGWSNQGRIIYFRSHNLRKWMANQLTRARMEYDYLQHLMGHRVGSKLDRAYVKPDPQVLRRAYVECMDYLAIDTDMEVRAVTTEDMEKVEALKDSYDQVVEENREIKEVFVKTNFKEAIKDRKVQDALKEFWERNQK